MRYDREWHRASHNDKVGLALASVCLLGMAFALMFFLISVLS